MPESLQQVIQDIYLKQSRKVLATLIRLFNGDFDLAEEALHEAFTAAMEKWSSDGVPENPVAWLISAGKFKAIDRLRKNKKQAAFTEELTVEQSDQLDDADLLCIKDDSMRLIFTCCHPSLSIEAQLALTLREVCGLTTEAIAAAFLVPVPRLAQRIVRAKNKIRDAKIPYEMPDKSELNQRLNSVLRVIYLVFNEGYSASEGDQLIDISLTKEAIRLAYQVHELLPEPEVKGLLALMLLHDSRREARAGASGGLIPLEAQDRHLWLQDQITEGCRFVQEALASRRFGEYSLQAAIAAIHAEAPSFERTNWTEIVGLYIALMRLHPSPVVELNLAVAVAMSDQAETGLSMIDKILTRGELQEYYLAHAAKADLLSRLNRSYEAIESYRKALTLTNQGPERKYISGRISNLQKNL